MERKDVCIYVHGKGGSAEEAGHYRPLFPNDEVIGFDYRAQTPWEAKKEFPAFFAAEGKRQAAAGAETCRDGEGERAVRPVGLCVQTRK